jgi:acetone carboxylase gamma subunit
MIPSEIRNIRVNCGKFGEPQDEGEVQVTANIILREIAAQLAEINEKFPRPCLASTGPK